MKGAFMLAGFVVLTLLGNYFFKRGAMEMAPISLSAASLKAAFASFNVWAGAAFYGLAAVFWFVSLSLVPLNIAITVSACIYVVVVLMAAIIFGEPMPMVRWAGIGLVFAGLVTIGRTL